MYEFTLIGETTSILLFLRVFDVKDHTMHKDCSRLAPKLTLSEQRPTVARFAPTTEYAGRWRTA